MIERSLDSLIEIFLYRDKLGVLDNGMTMIFQYIFLMKMSEILQFNIARTEFVFYMQYIRNMPIS